MLKLTEDEKVYAEQLFNVRREIAILKIEEATQLDRLMAILRGHQTHQAQGGEYFITKYKLDNREEILVTNHGLHPNHL